MPNITAYLTAGKIEATDDFTPTHWAYLIEGARPIWTIAPAGLFSEERMFKSRWFTSPDSVVDDAIAMIATIVEELPSIAAIAETVRGNFDGEVFDLLQLSPHSRRRLVELNRRTEHKIHLVSTVLRNSIVYSNMHNFVLYPISVDICTAAYSQDGALAKYWEARKRKAESETFFSN